MSTVLVRYRIARTGQPVPSGSPPPPDYVPWPHASITWRRIESDYGPGIVRPRDSITTRADEHGEGAVYLAPGRYRITLPSRDTRDVTVSAEPAEIDLSSLLAGGIEPEDPQYPTLLSQLREDLDAEMAEHMEEIEAAKEAAETARDAVLNLVPDPSEEPDGRVLVTSGGDLAYSPDLSKLWAVENIDSVVAWDDFSGSGSLDGRVTPSGHTWTVSPTDLGGRGWWGSGLVDNGVVRGPFGAYITFAESRSFYEVGARCSVDSIRECGIALGVPGAAVGIGLNQHYGIIVRQVHGGTATELASFDNPFDDRRLRRHLVVRCAGGILHILIDGVLVGRVVVFNGEVDNAMRTAAGIGCYDIFSGAFSFYVRDLRGAYDL